MKIILLFLCLVVFFLASYSQKKKANTIHKIKPDNAAESPISTGFIDTLVHSDYAKSLHLLNNHVTGHKVMNAATGNAGFILYLTTTPGL